MTKKIKRKEKKEEKTEQLSIPVYNSKGKEVEVADLAKGVFSEKVHKAAIYQAVLEYNANQRQGTVSTKTISEVSGGGRKPWAQKGTGRARHASIRSPLWPGGGIIFGPHPRDHHYNIPKKIKRLAVVSSLNSKVKDKDLICLDALKVDEPKTRKFKEILKALKLKGRTLFIVDSIDDNVIRSSRNLQEVRLRNYTDFNIMDILTSDKVVILKAALDKLTERLKG
jgi:large subunit ribosomal protein L4